MPYTLNGIGTWYWGKKNLHEEQERCSECGRTGALKSYDTGLYFVVLYLPIIPLGRKRIVRDCPHCRRHRVMPLAEWERLRRETMAQAAANYQSAPDSVDTATDLVRAAAVYQDRPAFESFEGALETRFAGEPRVLAALAEAHAYFRNPARAADAARAAQRLDPGNEAWRHRAAFLLIQARRTSEAAVLLQPECQRAKTQDEPFHWLLVHGYQAEGRHGEALEILNAMAEHYPASVQTKDYRKTRRASEKRRDSNRPVVVPALATSAPSRSGGGGVSHAFGRWFAPLLLTVLLASYLAVATYLGRHRLVYLVNGLDRPVVVEVNGKAHKIRSNGYTQLQLPEGKVRLKLESEETRTVLASSFWSRPFGRPVTILNPDRCALLSVDTATYRKVPAVGPGDGRAFRAPQLQTEYSNIDYVFEPLPKTVRLGSDSASVRKRGLFQVPVEDPGLSYSLLKAEVSAAAALDFARQWARHHPDHARSLNIYATIAPREEVLAFLKPLLAREPLLVEAHRCYQSLVRTSGSAEEALEQEYQARLAAAPGRADLMYLAARVALDRNASVDLMRQAASAVPPSAHANFALSFDALGQAEWERGLELVRLALRLRPGVEDFLSLERLALFGLRRFGEYLARPEVQRQLNSSYAVDVALPILAMDASGDRTGADRARTSFELRLQELASKGALDRKLAARGIGNLSGQLLAQRGLNEAAAAAFEKAADPFSACYVSMLRGQWSAALTRFEALAESRRLRTALLLYAGAAKAGDPAAPRAWAVCQELATKDSGSLALLFLRADPITLETVRGLGLEPEDKAAFAAAFAFRPVAERHLLLQFARTLAVVPGVESALVRAITE